MEIRMEVLGSGLGYPLPGSLTPMVAQRQAPELFCPPRPVRGWHDTVAEGSWDDLPLGRGTSGGFGGFRQHGTLC